VARMRGLRRLSLRGAGVGDAGVLRCAAALPALRRLELLDTGVTEGALAGLCRHPGLRRVGVRVPERGPGAAPLSVDLAGRLAAGATGGRLRVEPRGPDHSPALWRGRPLRDILHPGAA